MKARLLTTAAGFSVAMMIGSAASANVTFGFDCVSDNIAADCGIAESAFLMDLSDASTASEDKVLFTFRNVGPGQVTMTNIWWDWAVPLVFDAFVPGGSGVDYRAANPMPGTFPAGNNADPDFVADYGVEPEPPPVGNGIGEDEFLGVRFFGSYATVLSALRDSSLRVGVKAQDFVGPGSESLVNRPAPIPLPAAGWLLLAGIGGLAASRRMKKAA
jgi:hypothetical protein